MPTANSLWQKRNTQRRLPTRALYPLLLTVSDSFGSTGSSSDSHIPAGVGQSGTAFAHPARVRWLSYAPTRPSMNSACVSLSFHTSSSCLSVLRTPSMKSEFTCLTVHFLWDASLISVIMLTDVLAISQSSDHARRYVISTVSSVVLVNLNIDCSLMRRTHVHMIVQPCAPLKCVSQNVSRSLCQRLAPSGLPYVFLCKHMYNRWPASLYWAIPLR